MNIETLAKDKGIVVTLGIEPFMLKGLENELGSRVISDIENRYDLKLSLKVDNHGEFYDKLLEATEETDDYDTDYLSTGDYRKFSIEGLEDAPYIHDSFEFMKKVALRYIAPNIRKAESTTRMNLCGRRFREPRLVEQTLPVPNYVIDTGFKNNEKVIDALETWIINKGLTKATKVVEHIKDLDKFGLPPSDEPYVLEFDISGGKIQGLTLEEQENPGIKYSVNPDSSNVFTYKAEMHVILNDLKNKGIM